MTRRITRPIRKGKAAETCGPPWMDGPPTKPGLYRYQLQGSGVVRYCEVFREKGRLCVCGDDGCGSIPVATPYRRWAEIGRGTPHADPSWRDPRYLKESKR